MTTPISSTIAIIGNPNCGKSALFNVLTGLKQKVANYPGATVERHSGPILSHNNITLIDLPGTYSLTPRSMDEEISRKVLMGEMKGEAQPNAIIAVVDATNLAQQLRFILEIKQLGLPMVLAMNMTDLAARDNIIIDSKALSEKLGIPVVETVAVRKKGVKELAEVAAKASGKARSEATSVFKDLKTLQKEARALAKSVTLSEGMEHKATRTLDKILLNPILGPIILFGLLFLMFQSVFSWAEVPMGMIEDGIAYLQGVSANNLGDGFFASFINDGILAGVGSVIVFLPQIIILFTFILVLESTGYMARAAFLMDRLMSAVGLNGRAFIPLLSGFACAIPAMMAARSISNERDRLTTIMITPLMTCSARLPVYTVLIAAFIPDRTVGGVFNMQGVVMFSLYMFGIVSALIVAAVLKRTVTKGPKQPFLMELPKYQIPNLRMVLMGLIQRAGLFLRRAGTLIMMITIALWIFAIFPAPPEGATEPAITYSLVGILGSYLEVIFAPLGFNWEMSVALVPGLAAREVAVAALGTVYSLSGNEAMIEQGLVTVLRNSWSLPTAFSFLAWYVFAPMCLPTIAVAKRETGGWKWALFMLGYMFTLAYLAAFITYRVALALV